MEPYDQNPSSDVVDFIGRYLDDVARGEPRSLAEYLRSYPDRPEEIALAHERLQHETRAEREPPARFESLTEIGPYRLIEVLGQGGQAA